MSTIPEAVESQLPRAKAFPIGNIRVRGYQSPQDIPDREFLCFIWQKRAIIFPYGNFRPGAPH